MTLDRDKQASLFFKQVHNRLTEIKMTWMTQLVEKLDHQPPQTSGDWGRMVFREYPHSHFLFYSGKEDRLPLIWEKIEETSS